jgi:hypothetical protein
MRATEGDLHVGSTTVFTYASATRGLFPLQKMNILKVMMRGVFRMIFVGTSIIRIAQTWAACIYFTHQTVELAKYIATPLLYPWYLE